MNANGFGDQAFNLGKNRALGIRLIQYLIALSSR